MSQRLHVFAPLSLLALGLFLQPVYCEDQTRQNFADRAAGTVEGVVIYESDRKRPWRYRRNYVRNRREGRLAEAVVCLQGVDPLVDSGEEVSSKPILDQKDYNFLPETQAVRVNTVVTFTNSDPFRHDVTAQSSNQRFSIDLRQFDKIPRLLTHPGGVDDPVKLTCAYHSSMRGWIYVFDHPFFAVTGEKGSFRLEGVPAGKHRLVVVHPAGQLRGETEVHAAAGETTRVAIRLSPDNLVTDTKPNDPRSRSTHR